MALKENIDEKLKKNELKEENSKSEENEEARKHSRKHSRWATVLKLIEKRKAETGNISQVVSNFWAFFLKF